MASYSVGAQEARQEVPSDFAEFISLVKGRSIISAADWDGGRFELGLSGGTMVRFHQGRDGIEINFISTINPGEIPPLLLSLGDMPAQVPISIIEKKLHGLRTLYAIYHLAYSDRLGDLTSYLIRHPHGDIEQALIPEEESLRVESISYGSWKLAVWPKTQKGFEALSSVVGLAFKEGRQLFIENLKAQTRINQSDARKKEIEAARAEFDLQREQIEYLRQVSGSIPIPEVKEALDRIMINAVRNLTLGDPQNSSSHLQLTAKDD